MSGGDLAPIARLLALRCRLEWARGQRVPVGRLPEFVADIAPGLSATDVAVIVFEMLPGRTWSKIARDTRLAMEVVA